MQFSTILGHKKLIICISGTARVTFNPPASKIFIAFQLSKCEKSSTHRELSVQSGRHLPCLLVSMVGWLSEFWCTCSRDSAPLIKSRKFFYGTSFLLAKGKKIKIKRRPPAFFLKKVPEKHIIKFLWPYV